jgi:hypothetical protein
MSWSGEIIHMSGESVSDIWEYGSGETLMPGELANIFIHCIPGGITDDLDVRVDTSKDGTNWTTARNYGYIMECSGEAYPITSFVFSEFLHFKVGVQSSGSTDDHVISIFCVKDGVSIS